jgi:glycosyltransferase involved in cell wall biosynthesis
MTETPYPGVKSNEWNLLADGVKVYYFSSDRLSRKGICSLLENENYDFIYLNGIFSKYFTLIPLWYFRNEKGKKVVVASRGMLAESALAIKKLKKSLFLFFSKQLNLFGNVLFHATNEQEAAAVRKILGANIRIHIAPNLSEKIAYGEWKQKARSEGILKLVSIARIAPEKNIKYALEVLKEVRSDVQYDLFGPIYNNDYWNECRRIIQHLPANIKVNFKGSIDSKDVSDTILKYDFLFLPTQGENFGHVILQSMRVGVPVIISDKTMWRDLEKKKAGWDIPLSDKKRFVSVIEKCSDITQSEYNPLSRGAFDFASAYVNNSDSVEQNKQLFIKW